MSKFNSQVICSMGWTSKIRVKIIVLPCSSLLPMFLLRTLSYYRCMPGSSGINLWNIMHKRLWDIAGWWIYFDRFSPVNLNSISTNDWGPRRISPQAMVKLLVHFDTWKLSKRAPPKTNVAPEKWWLEDEFPFGFRPIFRCELGNGAGFRKRIRYMQEVINLRTWLT